MKSAFKIWTLSALFLLGLQNLSHAQINVSVRIGNPPDWAPRERAYQVRYYYLPELDAYYDAQRAGYFYASGPNWVFSNTLPTAYGGYDFYTGPKIEVNYFGDRPFEFFRAQRDGYLRQYHPGGRLDFTGNFLYRRGQVSGWDRKMNRHAQRMERREDRREDRRSRDRY